MNEPPWNDIYFENSLKKVQISRGFKAIFSHDNFTNNLYVLHMRY
jgi:hypothetical protein